MKINTFCCFYALMFLCYALLICGKIKKYIDKPILSSEKLKLSVKKLLGKSSPESDDDSESNIGTNLQISGDGSVYEYNQINVTNDGGKSYKLIDSYDKVEENLEIEKGITKEDLNPPSAQIEGIGAILPNSDDEEPKLYRLRNEVFFIFDMTEKSLHLIRGPIAVSQTDEKFPRGVTAAVNIGNHFYLLFRNDKFCRRKLTLQKTDNECTDGFKENSLLFRCKNAEIKSHKELCKDVKIDGAAMFYNQLFIFRGERYWIFQNSTSEHPGYFDSGDFLTSEKFNGFVEKNDGITSIGNGKSAKLIMFNVGKWWLWSINGKVLVDGNKIIETRSSNVKTEIKAEFKANTESNSIETQEKDTKTSDERYPSEKDGIYGAIIQLDHNPEPKFARMRGKEVYYFYKKGRTFEFTGEWIPVHKNKKKLPPDIQCLFKGPDERFYFIREDNYCRRPLNVSGIGLDPPDYCPEGGDVRELLGCNIHFYPPEVDELCHNPMIDNAFASPDGKNVYLFREMNYWILMGLPLNASFSPSKSFITVGGDATKTWTNFNLHSDAIFTMESGPETGRLIQFNHHRYTMWDSKGGQPLEEGVIKESPIKSEITVKPVVTEKSVAATTEAITKNENIVYANKEFITLCLDPNIDSADSNLNGSEVILFKDTFYYVLIGLREGEVGKLVKSGLSKDLYESFDTNSTNSAVMTCKEGYRRGSSYEFFGKSFWSSWDLHNRLLYTREIMNEIAPNGLNAVLHNRNVTDPVMIGLSGEDVHYFSTAGQKFSRKGRQIKYHETIERLPPRVTAAFSMPNQMIYLFRGKEYCVRPFIYKEMPPYCPKWRDNRELFGCFGETPIDGKVVKKGEKLFNDFEALSDLCSNLTINDADRLSQREDEIYVWRGARYWRIADFPHSPRVITAGSSSEKWLGFSESPDAVVIIQEGLLRRGWFFAMYNGHWSSWYPDNKPWVGYKAWWGHPIGSFRFGSMMHNGDINNPLVLGFDGKYVHYYKTDGSQLIHKGSKKLSVTDEVWPNSISAAFRMEDNTVYLFRGNKYCKRKWKCKNSTNNCCKEWKDAKELFGCRAVQNYRGEDYN